MSIFSMKSYKALASLAVKMIAVAVLLVGLGGCAGGSLFNPQPMNGRDRLVFRVMDETSSTVYYTRNVWYDGDNYRFHDVYGRDVSITKSDQVTVDIISAADYYETPE